MITLKELISITHCDASITIDTGCDFERFTIADYETITNNYGDSIITYINKDSDGLVIDCDMVGTDDDGIKRNFVTWETV